MSIKPKGIKIATIAKIGVLSALAVVLMFLEVPIFPVYPWLKLDIADIPALVGGFAMGPIAGIIIEAIKIGLSFVLKNSGTGGVGELANFTLAIALVLPATLIYRFKKSRSGAIIGLAVGTVLMTGLAPILNYYVLIPIFIQYLPEGFDVGGYIAKGAIPLTAIKAVLQSVLVILLYKPLSSILHKKSFKREKTIEPDDNELS
ncbi:MAG: ECF transporter S component [Clostridia bacterium]|jgi:riboflavin transporter|nr:ECF transporter S component [Clostridia bacterium]MBT7122897.1 ECF transporter S component [Clostridia bacterium]